MNKVIILLVCFFSVVVHAQTGNFDPDGYYFPEQKLVVADYNVECIELGLWELKPGGSAQQQKKPEPNAYLWLNGRRKSLPAQLLVVNSDSLFVRFQCSPKGIIEFSGEFLDKRGEFWNRSDNEIIRRKTVVLQGIVMYFDHGIIRSTKKCKFTYWEGD